MLDSRLEWRKLVVLRLLDPETRHKRSIICLIPFSEEIPRDDGLLGSVRVRGRWILDADDL